MKTKILPLLVILTLIIQSCDWFKEEDLKYFTGWLMEDENPQTIPDDVNLGLNSNQQIPSSFDLTPYFPPIGDQGQYGTCVAWATGYNHKSFLEAYNRKETNYTSSSKIMSPKDLFWAIDNSYKGSDCNGTNFRYAYDVMLNRGIATLSTVPYTNLGNCSSSPQNSWTQDAANHKIANYREISRDVNTIKSYIASGRPVAFGAKLGDEFMNYTGGIINYQSFNYSGQHAYHAMIAVGYDDNKHAFKIINSWGTNWGENGYVWVDYDYFVSDNFCFTAFVAADTQENPDNNNDNQVDDPTSGYDLIAWNLNDEDDSTETDARWRVAYYNVFNGGENTLEASKDWSIVYLLYNAYNGNDYQIVLFDYYTDNYGNNGENGELTDPNVTNQITAQGYWWNHVDVPSGWSVAKAVYQSSNETNFKWGYKMPNVTGSYYLVIFADAFDTFAESDESNNVTYYAAADGSPLNIVNGIIQNAPTKHYAFNTNIPTKNSNAPLERVNFGKNSNAYSPQEIIAKLRYDAKTGELQKRVLDFQRANTSKTKNKFKNS